jgi:signal transduction histidine kinase
MFSELKFSWAATGLYSLTSLIAAATAFPGQNVPFGTALLLALALTVPTALLIQLIAVLNKRFVSPSFSSSIYWFLSLVMFVGIVRGVGFYFLVDAFGLDQPTPLAVRIISSMITTCIWLTFSCALIESTASYSRQFSKLFGQTTMAVALRQAGKSQVDVDSLENIVALKKNLSNILDQASEKGLTAQGLLAAGAAVRWQIEELIRPLSHRLWFNERRNRTEVRLMGLIRDSIAQFSFVTPRFLFVWGALEFAALVSAYPTSRVLFGVALSLALISAVIFIFRTITKSRFPTSSRSTVIFIAIVAFVPVSLADLLMPLFGFERMLFPISAATVVAPIALVVLLIAESCIALVEKDRGLIRNLLETEIRASSDFNESSLASYLHNSLQSELTGLAYRLEASADKPESPASRETLEKLGALINRSISEDFANFDETPLLRLDRMIQAWVGIAAVTVEIDENCKTDSKHLNLIVQVIEEATTNSVRYGNARNISVQVLKTGSGTNISIDTDGESTKGASTGLGSDWLKQKSISVSSLEFSPKGTHFVVEM